MVKYCYRNMIYALWAYIVKKDPLFRVADLFYSFTFSKKIFHRRSLFHAALAVFHQFALQIDFIVGWSYPYERPTNGWFFFF